MSVFKKVFQYGGRTVTLETGEIAKQATSAVMIDIDGTTVLVTVVINRNVEPNQDFFPLTVNYQEKTYAAGKVPGGFFKREGRPSERETLIARLIDRPIRPLFPDGFKNEIQIVATVLSLNPEVDSDLVAIIGASAALMLSGAPFNGPIAAAHIGYREGKLLLNPTLNDFKSSLLDLMVAGTEKAVLMVESEASELPEDVMLAAVWFGHEQMQVVIQAIREFAEEAGQPKWDWQPEVPAQSIADAIKQMVADELVQAYQIRDKQARSETISNLHARVLEKFAGEKEETDKLSPLRATELFELFSKEIVRERVLQGLPRIDGRDTRTVRPLSVRVGVLPRTHGSALFTRGETQALVVATLGAEKDAQTIDSLVKEEKERFIFHYNFPPYCVGETGMMGSPKRREIGHGRLAKRGVQAVMPSVQEFPYVLRVVSEITESNGSSSMASVCGSSLALMDAGVPIKAQVAGIAMGLIKEDNKFAILTDIIGDEDHLGDMDFKVAGTEHGITALQMDIKIDGITQFIMEKALEQAREGRIHILGHMNSVISKPREAVSQYAPTLKTVKIDSSKIKDVIGKGGSTIKALIEETGADINIEDNGTVKISAPSESACEAAWKKIQAIVTDVEVGQFYTGKVIKLMDFGAVLTLSPGKEGFLHISQIADARVENINEFIKEGDEVRVKVVEVDRQGRVRVSMKPSVIGQGE